MSVTSRYREAWEGFWREAPDEPGAVFWDAAPERTAAVHLALYEPYLTDPDLPFVDLGCGNGTQTRFLADRFPRVLGADLSTAALDRARHADPGGRATYRLLDAADKTDAETLHTDLGDANVYVRGVLHQCEPDDRQRLVDSIATLLGERGRACLVELAEAAKPVLMGLAQSPTGPLPSSPRSSATASPRARSPTPRSRSTSAPPASPSSPAANSRCSPPSTRPTAPGLNCRRGGTWRGVRHSALVLDFRRDGRGSHASARRGHSRCRRAVLRGRPRLGGT